MLKDFCSFNYCQEFYKVRRNGTDFRNICSNLMLKKSEGGTFYTLWYYNTSIVRVYAGAIEVNIKGYCRWTNKRTTGVINGVLRGVNARISHARGKSQLFWQYGTVEFENGFTILLGDNSIGMVPTVLTDLEGE